MERYRDIKVVLGVIKKAKEMPELRKALNNVLKKKFRTLDEQYDAFTGCAHGFLG